MPHWKDDLIDTIAHLQGVEISREDIDYLCLEQARNSAIAEARVQSLISSGDLTPQVEIESKKLIPIVIAGAAGFASGGWVGAAIGIAAAVIQQIRTSTSTEKKERAQEQTRTFDAVSDVSSARFEIMRVYGDRSVNPTGGVRRRGSQIINQRIDTRSNRVTLNELYLISIGQHNGYDVGAIASIDDEKLLLDSQPYDQFEEGEIEIEYRLGNYNQPPYSIFKTYSQVYVPESYRTFGTDYKTKISNTPTATAQPANQANVSIGKRRIEKTSGAAGWNAGYFSPNGNDQDSFVQFSATRNSTSDRMAAGWSHTFVSYDWQSIEYGVYFNNGQAWIVESGAVRLIIPTYSEAEIWQIRYSALSGGMQYFRDEVLLYTSTVAPTIALYLHVGIFTPGAGLDRVRSEADKRRLQAATSSFQSSFNVADEDKLALGQDYRLRTTNPYGKSLELRSANGSGVVAVGDLSGIPNGTEIYNYWEVFYRTTKRVSEVVFNLESVLYARNRETNDLKVHGTLFDLLGRDESGDDKPANLGMQHLGRFIIQGKDPQKRLRAIAVQKLKLGNYRFRIRPLIFDDGAKPIYELTDSNQWFSLNIPQLSVLGSNPRLYFEGKAWGGGSLQIGQTDDGEERSSEGTPTTAIASINEMVYPQDLGQNSARYRSLATAAISAKASERISRSVDVSVFVDRGSRVRRLMAAGKAGGASSSALLSDFNQNFLTITPAIQVGWRLRNLSKKLEAQITAVTANTIATATPLNWEIGDRFLAFEVGPSCYFPDVAADWIYNPYGGVPDWIDPDWDVDYASFVRSRRFCVANQYFYDSEVGVPSAGFSQLMEQEAIGSRLFPAEIGGRVALIPDETTPPVAVFHPGNAQVLLSFPDWEPTTTNQVILTYKDGRNLFGVDLTRDHYREITAELTGVTTNGAYPVAQRIDIPSITNSDQAKRIANAMLVSLRDQDSEVSIETELPELHGLRIGDLFVASSTVQETTSSDHSGFIEEVVPGRFRGDCQLSLISLRGNDSTTYAAANYPGLGSWNDIMIRPGDRIIDDQGAEYEVITVTTTGDSFTTSAPIPCDRNFTIYSGAAGQTLQLIVTNQDTGSTRVGTAIASWVDGHVWYAPSFPVFPCERFVVGRSLSLYRASRISVANDGKVFISGTGWTPGMDVIQPGFTFWRDGFQV